MSDDTSDLPSASDAFYSGVGGIDAAAPMGSAAEIGAQAAAAVSAPAPSQGTATAASAATVKEAQGLLNTLGWSPALATDGIVGPKTQAAVSAFEGQHGLPVDGDPATAIAALRVAAAARIPVAKPAAPPPVTPKATPAAPAVTNAVSAPASALKASPKMVWAAVVGALGVIAIVAKGRS